MSLFGSSSASANATAPTVADGIRVQSSIAGKPVQIVYGSNRVSGNLIWYGGFQRDAILQRRREKAATPHGK